MMRFQFHKYWHDLLMPVLRQDRPPTVPQAIVLQDQQVLLVKRDNPRFWELPGGGMIPGETPEATIVREVQEETGYRLTLSSYWAGMSAPVFGPIYRLSMSAVPRASRCRHRIPIPYRCATFPCTGCHVDYAPGIVAFSSATSRAHTPGHCGRPSTWGSERWYTASGSTSSAGSVCSARTASEVLPLARVKLLLICQRPLPCTR